MHNFIKIWPDAFLAEDLHKGRRRLILASHGYKKHVVINGNTLNAFGLYPKLLDYANLFVYDYFYVASCESGFGGNFSLAAELSKIISGKEVKGFMNRFMAVQMPDAFPDVKNKIDKFPWFPFVYKNKYKVVTEREPLLVNKPDGYQYHSVTYLNGRLIKESRYENRGKAITWKM